MKKVLQTIQQRLPQGLMATFLVNDLNNGANGLASGILNSQNIPQLMNALFKLSVVVGATLAVLQLVYAGYLYMGSDLIDKKSEAKERIQNALVGLLLLGATFLIIQQINPDILDLNIVKRIPSVNQGVGTGGGSTSGTNTSAPTGANTPTPDNVFLPDASIGM